MKHATVLLVTLLLVVGSRVAASEVASDAATGAVVVEAEHASAWTPRELFEVWECNNGASTLRPNTFSLEHRAGAGAGDA